MKHKLWYAIIDGGDGSSSVYWFPSERLARFYYKYDMEIHLGEYAEDPVHCFSYEAPNPIKVEFDYTKEELLKQLRKDLKDEISYQAKRDNDDDFNYQPGIDTLKPLLKKLEAMKDPKGGAINESDG